MVFREHRLSCTFGIFCGFDKKRDQSDGSSCGQMAAFVSSMANREDADLKIKDAPDFGGKT